MEKQEAHINCRIYFGYAKVLLKFLPWVDVVRANFKMISRNISAFECGVGGNL